MEHTEKNDIINNNDREESSDTQPATVPTKKKRPLWVRMLKWTGWTVGGLFALLIIFLTVAIWILTPARLTKIVEDVANENLNADVKIGRVELTFWSSFPQLKIEVDNLTMLSHALDSLPAEVRASLPANADSLLSVKHFEGGINVLHAAAGSIALSDVLIERPTINLLQVDDDNSNFNIFPSASPSDSTSSGIPDIYINRFAITDAGPISYRSLSDTIDVELHLRTIELNEKSPAYALKLYTRIETPMLHRISQKDIEFSLDGAIGWSYKKPYLLKLENFIVQLAEINLELNTELDFLETLRIQSLDFKLNELAIAPLRNYLPDDKKELLSTLDTDMRLNITGRLTEPYSVGAHAGLPSMTAALSVAPCRFYFDKLRFNRVAAEAEATIVGNDPDRSVITLKQLNIDGNVVEMDLSVTLTEIFSDPRISGHFDGAVNFTKLPPQITDRLGADFEGRLSGATDFKFRLSDLNRNRFHRMRFDGELNLDRFRYTSRDSITSAYARHSKLTFGSNEKVKGQSGMVDSLLVVRMDADTFSLRTEGLSARGTALAATFGCSNTSESSDTTKITPVGGYVSIGRMFYNSEIDSIRIAIADTKGFASLQRYNSDSGIPRLALRVNIGRAGMLHSDISAGVTNSSLRALAYLRPRRSSMRDSITPDGDTIRRRRNRRVDANGNPVMTRRQLDSIGVGMIDFNVDNSLKSLLFRWNVRAEMKAERGRLRLAAIRLPNSFQDLDLAISTDSISLNSLQYRIGHTDLGFNGVVSNLRGALASRRPTPLRFDLNVVSDTININEIVHALSQPAANAVDRVTDDAELWAEEELHELEHPTETPDSVIGPILIPVNIDAGMTINARNVIYSDLLMKNLQGELLIYRGSLNLHKLRANTEVGTVNLSALYSAPTVRDMSFGIGMKLDRFYIDRLPKVIPAIDSIMPMMKSLSGVVDANIAVTGDLTPDMYFDMATLKSAMQFEGDSLELHDNKALRTLAKWLMFKDKNRSTIDHLSVEIVVDNGIMNLYPFIVDVDRYKLGIMGRNNMDFDLDYHIAVLKSPVPFKFGINIKGKPDNLKIRFGGAKFKENMVAQRDSIATSTRVNLLEEMNSVFRRGIKAAKLGPLTIKGRADTTYMSVPEDIISHQDSMLMIREGLIEAPDSTALNGITAPHAPDTPQLKDK